jgi:hypothetical protein
MSDNRNGDTGAWLAFANFNAPNGETWHVTLRKGATHKDIGELFDMISSASAEAEGRGFDGIVEGSEFGGTQWRSGMPVSLLKAERERRKAAAEKARAEKEKAQARRDAAQGVAAARATPPPPQAKQEPPAGQSTQQSGYKKGWDLKKSPIEIGKILVQGTEEKPKIQLWSPNPGLRHAVWSNVSPKVIMACFRREYDLSGMTKVGDEEATLEVAVETMLNTIGKEVDGLQWYVHWEQNEQNAAWKDIVSIEVTRWNDIRKEGT